MLAAKQLRNNDGQWEAYRSEGNCVILAGPGSGKTKTLTIKLARMLAEDVRPPRGIACITFNNQCARELKRRLAALGVEDGRRATIGTLHSFCLQHIVLPYAQLAKLPKKYPITVASTSEVQSLQEEAMAKAISADERWGARFDKYRKDHLDREAPEWLGDDEGAARAIEIYESLLDEKGLVDFDGMVLIGLHLVKKYIWVRKALAGRFPILVVDEYQDLGHALDQIVQCLCFDAGMRLVAVGDPDQSIYGFTGAEPALLQRLTDREEIDAVRLNLNYRCGSKIIQASEAALGETRGFASRCEEPGVVFFHDRPQGIADQAEFVCSTIIPAALERRKGRKIGDVAILYLDKNDGNAIANAVGKTDWQFIRVDGNNPYQPSPVTCWLEDCAAWCAGAWKTGTVHLSDLVRRWLAFNEGLRTDKERRAAQVAMVTFLHGHREPNTPLCDWLSLFLEACLREVLDREPRLRDDKDKVAKLLEVTSPEGALEAFTVAFFGGQGGSPDHLTLTTLHSAKGLEYDVVVMVGLEEGRIPHYVWNRRRKREEPVSDHAILESRRLFYVGLTRSRHEVHLLYTGSYTTVTKNGREWNHAHSRSRFVDEVARSILDADDNDCA